MRQKGPILLVHALSIVLLIGLLFSKNPDSELVLAVVQTLTIVALFILLLKENFTTGWDGTHWLAVGQLILLSIFLLLYFTTRTDLTLLFGAVLILCAFTLFIVEAVIGWRDYTFLNYLMHSRRAKTAVKTTSHDPVNSQAIVNKSETNTPVQNHHASELVQNTSQTFFAIGGGDTYHCEDCRTLRNTSVADLIHFRTRAEAETYGLKPCKICKP